MDEYNTRLRIEKEKQDKVDDEEFLHFDALLRRDWFVNDYDIIDLVWQASEEVFERIKKNIHTYSDRIQEVLMYTFDPPKFSTKQCRDLSDDEMAKMANDMEQQTAKKVDEAWKIYKEKHGLSRPDGDLDERYTDLYDQLQEKKKELETFKKNAPKKYVPPSMRGKEETDPALEALEKKIFKLKNEIVEVKKDIELEEQIWENGRKASVYQQLLESVQ